MADKTATSAKARSSAATAAKWAERLRGRSRMAVAAIGGVFLAGFLGVSRPLSKRVDSANERLSKAETRMMLAGDVLDLRRQAALYGKKLPRGVDTNDWTNYMLTIIRAERVKLLRMEPKEAKSLGPCKALAWQIEMQGDFASLSRIVQKLEHGERLIRIDRLIMQNIGRHVMMTLQVKGLALDVPPPGGKQVKDKGAAPAAPPAEKVKPVGNTVAEVEVTPP